MKTPLVSVYITNYNYAAYIRQSIESVLNQSLQDFELFIIDDGSKDNSKEIIEEFRGNPKITIIYQQNKGLNITNNIAMRASVGKYIMRLDADDFLEKDALKLMSEVLEKDEQLGLVFPDYYYVDANGNITGEERRHNFEKEVSLYDQPAHGACTMIRLEFLKNLGGYNESFTCQDGYDLWIKFITHHKVTNINQSLFSYRRHGNNLTTNEERILDTRKKIKELFVKEHLKTPKTLAVIPARNTKIGDINWPLFEINGISIIEQKVIICQKAQLIDKVIVSSSDNEILEHCKKWAFKYDKLEILERPISFSKQNVSLDQTLEQALNFADNKWGNFEAIMSVSLEYPFIKEDILNDAVNTLTLFKADVVLTVRPDNRMYYRHTGHTLIPILDQNKFTKLEREAIYKGAGGLILKKIDIVNIFDSNLKYSISHVIVNERESFFTDSQFHFDLFKNLNS